MFKRESVAKLSSSGSGGKHCLHARFQCFRRGSGWGFIRDDRYRGSPNFWMGTNTLSNRSNNGRRWHESPTSVIEHSPNTGRPREKEPRVQFRANEISELFTALCAARAIFFKQLSLLCEITDKIERERKKERDVAHFKAMAADQKAQHRENSNFPWARNIVLVRNRLLRNESNEDLILKVDLITKMNVMTIGAFCEYITRVTRGTFRKFVNSCESRVWRSHTAKVWSQLLIWDV